MGLDQSRWIYRAAAPAHPSTGSVGRMGPVLLPGTTGTHAWLVLGPKTCPHLPPSTLPVHPLPLNPLLSASALPASWDVCPDTSCTTGEGTGPKSHPWQDTTLCRGPADQLGASCWPSGGLCPHRPAKWPRRHGGSARPGQGSAVSPPAAAPWGERCEDQARQGAATTGSVWLWRSPCGPHSLQGALGWSWAGVLALPADCAPTLSPVPRHQRVSLSSRSPPRQSARVPCHPRSLCSGVSPLLSVPSTSALLGERVLMCQWPLHRRQVEVRRGPRLRGWLR